MRSPGPSKIAPRSAVRPVALVAAAVLLGAACTSGGTPSRPSGSTSGASGAATISGTPRPSPSVPVTPSALPVSLVEFGAYQGVPLTDPDSPASTAKATPTSLSGVRIATALTEDLKQRGVSGTLTRQGFVVVPADFTQLQFAYQGAAYGGWPVYVTTDAAYHLWHLTFDAVLRTTEEQALTPALRSLLQQSLAAAHTQTTRLAGTRVADAAARAEQLYQVAATELGLPVTLGPLAKQEKALVDGHAGPQVSPLLGVTLDYSLMTPRGHYTRTATLKRYFVAMSVLGQSGFCLPGTRDCATTTGPTRVGLLATRVLLGSPQRKALWQKVYEPTAFLVGLSDDYTPVELDAAARAAVPAWANDAAVIADDVLVAAIVARLRATRQVRIDPEKASVRLMGTRFVLDSFVMDQLIAPTVGAKSDGAQRLLPSALDVAAAFGSSLAKQQLERSGAMTYPGYPQQLQAMIDLVGQRPAEDWGGTVYDAWLAALQPVLARHGTAYPPVMRSQAWAAKDLQSGLGSYAQLKHDTILYTKQAVAEGGGDEPQLAPRHWVEPEPVAYARLASAVDLLRTGLTRRGLLGADQAKLTADLHDLLTFFTRIATDELAGTAISTTDNRRLAYIGESFEALWFRTTDRNGEDLLSDKDSALIADIASGPDAVLEVGTGRFDRLYILVPDDSGRFQVAAGAVFSFYEFSIPAGQRLTDETWRARLDAGQAPARPTWAAALFPR